MPKCRPALAAIEAHSSNQKAASSLAPWLSVNLAIDKPNSFVAAEVLGTVAILGCENESLNL
jgi:hypothetical protein